MVLGCKFLPVWLQVVASVLTNAAGLPMVVYLIVRAQSAWAWILVWTAITSGLYHCADTVQAVLFGLSPGQWHRLDNVFAISAFQVLFTLLLFPRRMRVARRDAWTWGLFCWTLVCQEAGPWDITFTILPLATHLIAALVVCFVLTPAAARPQFHPPTLRLGIALVLIAFFFFSRGLDEDNDWIRLNHGLWHVFISLAFYTLVLSRVDAPLPAATTLV
ncbi:uncharacterized protein AMSG_00133 [Thecamonas trahens ATCC 50062]|uniref:Uncharacterized protein n=1 Tax=Thecamonas trahens ATCC 50062 TaxID=461836 RepID=A0A0L0D1K1_THETB|nr:hypothetical protein AMSG_00133 [Thecamonas trahens ATCC 50062]KNC46015.1 hypothetical protein AMSG_00133 [Thecamonas trahens ATCC 50062]|eukprot:XP_013762995.1 hypothetical protein AMSG_00133 [Thecamonas trahens ATCC 50062]